MAETRDSWQSGMERGFLRFGEVTEELLIDKPKALVRNHDIRTRKVEFSEPFPAFARYWGFEPIACARYRACTKGKDESGVGYVKKNAIAGRSFASCGDLEGHLALVWSNRPSSRALLNIRLGSMAPDDKQE